MRKKTNSAPDIGTDQSNSNEICETTKRRRTLFGVDARYFIVQAVLALYNFARIFETVGKQYVFSRVAESRNISTHVTGKSLCFTNKTGPQYTLQQEVQAEATQWQLYLSLGSGIPALFSIVILGTYSDRFGRRFIMLTSCVASCFRALVYIVVIKLRLSILYLLIGHIVEGLAGFQFAVSMATYAYTSDFTGRDKTRSFLMILVRVTIDFSQAVADIISGYAIKDIGFYLPNVLSIGLLLANIAIIFFFLPEREASLLKTHTSLIKYVYRSFQFYFAKENGGLRKIYILGISIYLFPAIIHYGSSGLGTFFRLNSPLCWDAVKIGTFNAIDSFIHPFGLLLMITVLQRWFSDLTISLFGAMSALMALTLLGFARNDGMMIAMFFCGMIALAPMVLTKAILSKITDPDQQGALFSGFGFVEALSYVVAQFIYTSIYQNTLKVMTGAVFLVMAGQYVITTGLILILMTQKKMLKPKSSPDDVASLVN